MSDKRVVVVGDRANQSSYYRPFESIAPQGSCEMIFSDPDKVICAVFTGGEDVDPSMYDTSRNHKTYCDISRDLEEKMYFDEAVTHGIPMVGICRGSQFLCVMNGGKLAQHVSNHACGQHTIRAKVGRNNEETIQVTSTHHQMQLPPKKAIVLAWAEPKRSDFYEGADGEELHPEMEYEGVLYPVTRSLGMQWHPEYMNSNSRGFQYSVMLIQKLLRMKTHD